MNIQEFKQNISTILSFNSTGNVRSQLSLLQNRLDNTESGISEKIDPRSKAKLEELKRKVNQKLTELNAKLTTSKGAEKKDINARINELKEALEEIKVIERSQTEYEFRVHKIPNFKYEDVNDKGVINYDGTIGSLLNEIKHAFQFETGKIDFIKINDGVNPPENIPGLLYDITDEVETYKRQYAYDGILKLRVVMTDDELLNQLKSGKIKSGLGLGTLEIKRMNKIKATVIVKVEDYIGSGSLYSSIGNRNLDINSSLGDIRKGNKNRQGLISGLGINTQNKKKSYIDFVKVYIQTNPFIYVKY